MSLTPVLQVATSTPKASPTALPTDTEIPPVPTKSSINPVSYIVGAIRWDAWVGEDTTFGNTGDNRIGLAVEQSLSPAKWHYRLPFYAVELNENAVQVRGNTQAIMDQEILYAVDAGLDYWAFVYFALGTGLDSARNLYLSSPYKNSIKFSLIITGRDLRTPASRHALIEYFEMQNYQTVLKGRPLIYIFGSTDLTYENVDSLRAEMTAANLTPYFVYLGWSVSTTKSAIESYGFDAGSIYAQSGYGGQPFVTLAQKAESGWESYRQSGIKVIPWVTSGWDPRPRINNPVISRWTNYPADQWIQTAKPAEIVSHLKDALYWSAKYPKVAETKAILIYAWNEFDEGGWLCPTLRYGDNRLKAIRTFLRP